MSSHNQRTTMMNAHAHRNSFSASTFSNHFGTPQQQQLPIDHKSTRTSSLECPWPVYAMDWSQAGRNNPSNPGSIVIGSFCDDIGNRLQVIHPSEDGDLIKTAEIDATLPYPVTKVMWEPPRSDKPDATMLATAGDYLRVFSVSTPGDRIGKIRQEVLLGNTKADFAAPLTSFDWNQIDPSIIVTASVDTTCTVWDLNTSQARTQLIAHDKEVFDVTFTAGSTDVFASVGSDGSVRLFDLRALEHSTIIYESPILNRTPIPTPSSQEPSTMSAPLMRVSACQRDANLLATFHNDSTTLHVLDIRHPGQSILDLDAHMGSLNAIQWSPTSRNLLATCADDAQVLVWDCNAPVDTRPTPVLSWTADVEVNNISWNAQGDKISAAYGKTVQVLKLA